MTTHQNSGRRPDRRMPATGGSAARRNMPALTILRAFLAWWVVAFHAAPLYPFSLDQKSPLLGCGVICVDCFFVLSGFVLFNANPFLLDRRGPEVRKWGILRDFFVARFARIYPLHAVMLCAFVLLILGTRLAGMHLSNQAQFTPLALVNQLLLLHGSLFPDTRSWNYPSWSVGAEALAYLAAPVVFLLVSRLPHRLVPAAMLAGAVAVVGLTEINVMTRSGMISCRVLLEFGLGALMCRVTQQFRVPMLRARFAALPLGLALAAGLAWRPDHGPFLAAMLWSIAFLSLRSSLRKGLAGRVEAVWIHLGETSFAVYICHAFVLTLWAGAMTRLDAARFCHALPAGFMLLVTIQAMAMSLNRFVEQPASRWIRSARFGRRPILVTALPTPLPNAIGALAG